jgi:hypothetical protein
MADDVTERIRAQVRDCRETRGGLKHGPDECDVCAILEAALREIEGLRRELLRASAARSGSS